jgi:hypothetical protein
MRKNLILLKAGLLCLLTAGVMGCEQEDTPPQSIVPCKPTTEFETNINNLEAVILLSPDGTDTAKKPFIIIAKLFDDTEPTVYLIQSGGIMRTTYRICNYPEYAKQWNIPKEGLNVELSGNVYYASYDWGYAPAIYGFRDLELTALKRN